MTHRVSLEQAHGHGLIVGGIFWGWLLACAITGAKVAHVVLDLFRRRPRRAP